MIELKSQRIQLKPYTSKDLEELHAIFTDDEVKEFLWDNETIPKGQTEEILNINESQFNDERCGLWKIVGANNKEVMGFVGLWYFYDELQPQLLYGILPVFMGYGYATEASKLIINYAFKELEYAYLMAATDKPHHKSQEVLARLGFELIEEKTIDGKPTVFYRKNAPVF